MERLPLEIVAKIATYLPEEYESKRILPGLATLSRSWQYAVESITFESLFISSDDLEAFSRIFARHTQRRSFLRHLNLDIILPPHSYHDRLHYERTDDRAVNNHVFNHDLSTLLQELSKWPAEGKLEFMIRTHSPMDLDRNDYYELLGSGFLYDPERDFPVRYMHSHIRLTRPLTVFVPRVTGFHTLEGPRHLDPGSVVALTNAFPNLERIYWPLADPVYFLPQRCQQMHELTSTVASFQTPSSCKALQVVVDSRSYPHKERLPNLNSGKNSFCGSLCTLLEKSNIQSFHYSGLIDPTLFWPQEDPQTDKGPPPWESLQEMKVEFGLGSLAGQWFFKGRPDGPSYEESSEVPLPQDAAGFLPPGFYDSDEQNDAAIAHEYSWEKSSHTIRHIPRDEAILPLLTAIARRLAHTPSLRKVRLESRLTWERGIWFFRYYAPGKSSRRDDSVDREELGCGDPVSRARVFLYADNEWRPDVEVMALLRGIGRACHGKDAIVTFLPGFYDYWGSHW